MRPVPNLYSTKMRPVPNLYSTKSAAAQNHIVRNLDKSQTRIVKRKSPLVAKSGTDVIATGHCSRRYSILEWGQKVTGPKV